MLRVQLQWSRPHCRSTPKGPQGWWLARKHGGPRVWWPTLGLVADPKGLDKGNWKGVSSCYPHGVLLSPHSSWTSPCPMGTVSFPPQHSARGPLCPREPFGTLQSGMMLWGSSSAPSPYLSKVWPKVSLLPPPCPPKEQDRHDDSPALLPQALLSSFSITTLLCWHALRLTALAPRGDFAYLFSMMTLWGWCRQAWRVHEAARRKPKWRLTATATSAQPPCSTCPPSPLPASEP